MTLTRAPMAALLILAAAHAKAATVVDSVEVVEARIADAKQAATAARKAADTICGNTGYAMGQRELGLRNNAERA